MYEVRHAGVKGFGLFATRAIPKGSRILAERPLLSVKSESEVFATTRSLSQEDREALLQLSISPIRKSSVLGWTQAAWQATRQALSEGLKFAQRDSKAAARLPTFQSITEHPEVLNVFRNNNFDLGGGKQAVFLEISRINHACVPNAQGNFNSNLEQFAIHAIRDITTDEEITLGYLAEHGALKESRQSRLLSNYGFLCDCPACDSASPRSQVGEERRLGVQAKLHEYARQAEEREHPDLQTELGMTKELIELFETEGLAGRELATMYLTAAELAAKAGKGYEGEVAMYAEKGLRLDLVCLGQDNPLFGASVARAQAITGARHDQ